jgi:ABC-type branched-subunit amino acid transport system substrate-binding protein
VRRPFKLIVAALLVLACAVITLRTGDAAQSPPLTPQERRGKALYLRGESAAGREVSALVGELDVPAATVPCAGCHGLRGEGKTEAGVTAGALTWSQLTRPDGHTHPTGRKHGPFNETSFVRAVVNGLDPAGNALLVAMPRYKLAPEDLADLLAYLKRIETEREPGLTADAITVAAPLPLAGALADTGAAMRDVLNAYFADVNSRGGVYNRRLELRAADASADAAQTAANLRRLLEGEQVFALVGGVSAGADKELAALAAETGTPLVGPATLLPQTGTPLNRYVFYLLPGFAEQARALANFAAARPELKRARLAVVYANGELTNAAADAFVEQAKQAGLPPVFKQTFTRGSFNAAQLVEQLQQARAEGVLLLGPNGEETPLLQAAAAAKWTPFVFLLGALSGTNLGSAVPTSFKDHVFVTFPTVPADVTPEGLAEFRALQEKYKFAPRRVASQLAALAAAKVFVEGLKRAGRDLTREQFITALEGLYEYDTGLTPRLTFGPNRRVGAAGASVLTFDPEKKELAPAGGWVKAN